MHLDSTVQYCRREYWEKRYEDEANKEWLCNYQTISHILRTLIKPDDNILIIGCGNSPFSSDLAKDGYSNVTNIDYASSVIKNMATKYPNMKWIQMDMRRMEFESRSYNVVIEKATLDALLSDEKDSWNISDAGALEIDRSLKEISRVLTEDGVFISVSFAQPHFRLPLYARTDYDWSVDVATVGEHFHHFVYTMTKGQPMDTTLLQKYSFLKRRKKVSQCLSLIPSDDEDFWRKISFSE